MTINEIRALIAQKIAGQGSMVDAGGGLPAILNALCDAIEAIPAPPAPYVLPTASAETLGGVKVGDGLQISENGVLSKGRTILKINGSNGFTNKTKAEAAELLGITEQEFDDMMAGRYDTVDLGVSDDNYLTLIAFSEMGRAVLFGAQVLTPVEHLEVGAQFAVCDTSEEGMYDCDINTY